jgi:hypothetical protein
MKGIPNRNAKILVLKFASKTAASLDCILAKNSCFPKEFRKEAIVTAADPISKESRLYLHEAVG